MTWHCSSIFENLHRFARNLQHKNAKLFLLLFLITQTILCSCAANFSQICVNGQKYWNNALSNDGLSFEMIYMSHGNWKLSCTFQWEFIDYSTEDWKVIKLSWNFFSIVKLSKSGYKRTVKAFQLFGRNNAHLILCRFFTQKWKKMCSVFNFYFIQDRKFPSWNKHFIKIK